jgi:hypothetical protein
VFLILGFVFLFVFYRPYEKDYKKAKNDYDDYWARTGHNTNLDENPEHNKKLEDLGKKTDHFDSKKNGFFGGAIVFFVVGGLLLLSTGLKALSV